MRAQVDGASSFEMACAVMLLPMSLESKSTDAGPVHTTTHHGREPAACRACAGPQPRGGGRSVLPETTRTESALCDEDSGSDGEPARNTCAARPTTGSLVRDHTVGSTPGGTGRAVRLLVSCCAGAGDVTTRSVRQPIA